MRLKSEELLPKRNVCHLFLASQALLDLKKKEKKKRLFPLKYL